jgi:hypothetical protein
MRQNVPFNRLGMTTNAMHTVHRRNALAPSAHAQSAHTPSAPAPSPIHASRFFFALPVQIATTQTVLIKPTKLQLRAHVTQKKRK